MSQPLEETYSEWMGHNMRNSLGNFLRFAKEKNLSLPQLNILIHLVHNEDCNISGMGIEFGVTNAAISQLLDKLVQQGYVNRHEDPQDRRNKILVLTEDGRRIANEGMLERKKWFARLVTTLTDEEKQQVDNSFSLLINKAALLEEIESNER